MKLQPGDKLVKHYAIFDGEKQITKWQRNRQNCFAAMSRSSTIERKPYILREKLFLHRPEEKETAPPKERHLLQKVEDEKVSGESVG